MIKKQRSFFVKVFSWNLKTLIVLNNCGYATLSLNCEAQKIYKKNLYVSIKSMESNNNEIEIIARKIKEGSDRILFCGNTQTI